MWDDGWTRKDLEAFKGWWSVEYAWASKPPHVSQIDQNIADAVEWQQAGGQSASGPANEYEYASAAAATEPEKPENDRPKVFRSRKWD